ncbi:MULTISPECIES: LacI family DNA-binding transcriptional regulator [unclassified Pseudoclavibacter]|uniref:LacI family DNA-binding transcriptional regulator n=1 Tax=unclassified Pseudoclavibacter TaxID=2615177 RepID=UPI001BA67818|nr:substrate-binding domain-containing protein [Pseudoclavibacter sp. Marseille-Q4354]MBS3179865.1 DeoR/GlpR family transcriptional regulator [Pseudoclavibacter sp. Marseille-Q4354]
MPDSTRGPLSRTRHAFLLRELELRGSVTAADAAQSLGVSQVTVRRDIVELENAGKLARVHGGAIRAVAKSAPKAARVDVGVIVPSSVSHFPGIVRGMEAASHALRARIVLAVSHYRPELERRQAERLIDMGVQGVVLAATLNPSREDELGAWVRGLPVPVVFLERRLDSTALASFDAARTDHARGATLAVEHLAGLGHGQIALALYERTPTAPLIRDGYERAVRRLDLAPAPQIALPKGEGDASGTELDIALERILDDCMSSKTTAIVVHTDVHAARLVELASDRGMRVPEDLAVVAYDDDTAALAMVPLTAVTAPRADLGREALRILVERIAQTDGGATAKHLELVPTLTVRSSCGGA